MSWGSHCWFFLITCEISWSPQNTSLFCVHILCAYFCFLAILWYSTFEKRDKHVFPEVTNGEGQWQSGHAWKGMGWRDLWMKIVVGVEDDFQYQGGMSFTKLSPVNPKPGVVIILMQNLPPTWKCSFGPKLAFTKHGGKYAKCLSINNCNHSKPTKPHHQVITTVSPLIGIIEERPKTNNLVSDYSDTKCEKLHAIFLQPLNSSHWHNKSNIIAAEQP